MPQPETASAHAFLRTATADLHRAVEDGFAGLDLTRRDGYRHFLEVHALVIPAVESSLEACGIEDLMPDWPARRRRHALMHDLSILGSVTPISDTRFVFSGPAALLGAAYVLEGSRLGAQVILRMTAESADPAVRAATHFLRHGAGQRLWPSFLELLNATVGELDKAGATAAARAVFAGFLDAQAVSTKRPRAAAEA